MVVEILCKKFVCLQEFFIFIYVNRVIGCFWLLYLSISEFFFRNYFLLFINLMCCIIIFFYIQDLERGVVVVVEDRVWWLEF